MDGGYPPFRAPVTALDGPAKVTGGARYTFDIAIPGMLHAKVLRSPHPHARIVSIDTSRAEALPGVFTAVTGADAIKLPDPYYGVAIRDQPVIAIDKVRYVGDMVAAVAAIDEETAYRALTLIDVEYELLPPVTTATTPGSASAWLASIETMRACGCGLRSTLACSMPGMAMSNV